MSLTAAAWPQFATQVLRGGIGRLTCIGSYVNKQVTTFIFRAQATTCSKHHTRTVMDADCECALWVRSANPSDSWALVLVSLILFSVSRTIHCNTIFALMLILAVKKSDTFWYTVLMIFKHYMLHWAILYVRKLLYSFCHATGEHLIFSLLNPISTVGRRQWQTDRQAVTVPI